MWDIVCDSALETVKCYLSWRMNRYRTGARIENGIAFKVVLRNNELLAGEKGLEGREYFTGWGGDGRGVRV